MNNFIKKRITLFGKGRKVNFIYTVLWVDNGDNLPKMHRGLIQRVPTTPEKLTGFYMTGILVVKMLMDQSKKSRKIGQDQKSLRSASA